MAGMLVVFVVVFGLQTVAVSLHPLPEGLDPLSPDSADALAAHMATLPALSWAIGFGSELLGAFFGGLTAGWVARAHVRLVSGTIVGLALVGSVNNWMTFEHPLWFVIGQLLGYPMVLMAVWRIVRDRVPVVLAEA